MQMIMKDVKIMTFDEAVREYRFRSSIGPLVQGIELSPFVNVPQQEYDQVKFLNNLFYATINKLREEYAPTIEMTSGNKATFMQDGDSLSKLLTGYYGFDELIHNPLVSDK